MKRKAFVIIGAGIAGLSAAIALKNIGIEALVVEASEEIKPVGAGLSLAANAMEALLRLKIADKVMERGRELKSFVLLDKKGRIVKKVDAQARDTKVKNFTIHRAYLHEVLLSEVDPINVITRKRSLSLTETSNGFRVTMTDGSVIEASYLIIAEGIHSPLRQQLAPGSKVRYSGYTCWRGIADNAALKLDETSETWGPQGRFGIVPLNNNQIYWFACKNAKEPNSDFKNYTLSDLAADFWNYHKPVVDVIKATRSQHLIWGDICDLEPIEKFAYGNALLIGDAAHATTPNMGQGACMAIEDAVVLGNCMLKNSKITEAFKSFERQRIERAHRIVKESWRLGKIAQLENEFLSTVRDSFFRLIPQRLYERQLESIYKVNLD